MVNNEERVKPKIKEEEMKMDEVSQIKTPAKRCVFKCHLKEWVTLTFDLAFAQRFAERNLKLNAKVRT